MKNVSFILQKNLKGLFNHINTYVHTFIHTL